MAKKPNSTDGEIWKPIPGLDGYEASSLGRLRSIDHMVHYDYYKRVRGRVRKTWQHPSGHLMAGFSRPIGTRYVHKLIMLAFVGPCPNGYEVAHNDGDPTNNKITNLRYATRPENIADRSKHAIANWERRNADDQTGSV